jgi:copper(I)-binding protein
MKYLIASLLAAGLLLSASVQATQAAHVRSSHAWIRTLPGSLPAGGYVVLENDADQPATLTNASSAAYASVMLHRSSTEGGMSRMTMVEALAIPAHGKVVLAPAGYHLMLMQAKTSVKPGDTVKLTLTFADGSSLPADFIARPANAMDEGAAVPAEH